MIDDVPSILVSFNTFLFEVRLALALSGIVETHELARSVIVFYWKRSKMEDLIWREVSRIDQNDGASEDVATEDP